MAGHIPNEACRASFSTGDHDRITDEILRLIDNGAKCSSFDPSQLTTAQAAPPALKTSSHYLCVCLGGKDASAKCLAAVKAACLVGDIPAGDCDASLTGRLHDGVTDHVLRLIDQGNKCDEKYLPRPRAGAPSKPPARFSSWLPSMSSKPKTGPMPNAGDKDLCVCLDDPRSAPCRLAMKRTCVAGRIPREDCDVAIGGNFWSGASRHALRLIDHGAECPAHRAMTFTNRGCHCLQSWTEDGKKYTFPNNCADPGGKRGYAWCKTYADESCAGVGGSVEWDRCDQPKFPSVRGAERAGEDDPDHYLCVCVEDGVDDEVCVAAVRAACQVGHLPSEACQASFGGNHKSVSDLVVQAIQGGQKCGLSQISGVPTGPCGFGKQLSSGKCDCPPSYVGARCERCAPGYFGYPDCRTAKQCPKSCGRGTCDPATGACMCPPNYVGETCSQCAPGASGRHCENSGGGVSFGQVVVYVVVTLGVARVLWLWWRGGVAAVCGSGSGSGSGGKRGDDDDDDDHDHPRSRWARFRAALGRMFGRGGGASGSARVGGGKLGMVATSLQAQSQSAANGSSAKYMPFAAAGGPGSFKAGGGANGFDDDDFESGIDVPVVVEKRGASSTSNGMGGGVGERNGLAV